MNKLVVIAALFLCFQIIGYMVNWSNKKSLNMIVGVLVSTIVMIAGFFILNMFFTIKLSLFLKFIALPTFGISFLIGLISKSSKEDKKTQNTKGYEPFSFSTNNKPVHLYDPFNNFLVYGGQGAGKTKSIGKPLLREYIKNHFAGFIYDLKDDDFTKTAYHLTTIIEDYPYKFYYANFQDMERTYRFNPFKKSSIPDEELIPQYAADLLDAYLPKGSHKNEFYLAGLGILQGVAARFYKDYEEYCTIPHILNFILHNNVSVIQYFLSQDSQSRALANGYLSAAGSPKTQASYLSSLTTYIGSLASNKKMCWVLSGDDFDFNLIDPENPKLFAISNSFKMQSIFSPVIALILKISSRRFDIKNKVNFAYILDEATTFKIDDFENMPSVLREYNVSFCFLTQSASKILMLYGKEALSSIQANFVNTFYGRTKDDVALDTYVKMFSKIEKRKESFSTGSSVAGSSSGKSYRIERELKFEREDFTNLKPGEFVINGNASRTEEKIMFQQFQQPDDLELPKVRIVTEDDINNNYEKIVAHVKSFVIEEYKQEQASKESEED